MPRLRTSDAPVLIEGYASLFGVEDMVGDVVRAGAFASALARGVWPAMLLSHSSGRIAGRWTTMREDGRGLFVRGLLDGATVAGRAALAMIGKSALDGLSIGFHARDWRARAGRSSGRELREIDLREVSLVASPACPGARFRIVGGWSRPVGREDVPIRQASGSGAPGGWRPAYARTAP